MRIFLLIVTLWYSVTLSAQERITLLFVGDLMQHGDQIKAAKTPEGYDYSDCFKHVKEEIGKADIAIGNLEVTFGGKPYTGYPAFSAPDEYLHAIKDAGFDILVTANNHCLDRQGKGLERTILLLDSLGIPHAGTYADVQERDKRYPLLIEKNGFRIALLAYTYDTNGLRPTIPNHVNYIDKEQIKKDIQKARLLQPDAIIACMHWGIEYRSLPSKAEKELAQWLIHQGVDHIIGSHPHVIQPIEVQQDSKTPDKHLIVYSLGNYISNMSKERTDGGLMVKLELKKFKYFTRLSDCNYSLVWTSRPILSKKSNFEVYPSSFINKPIQNEEFNKMSIFLKGARSLLDKYNIGIKERE